MVMDRDEFIAAILERHRAGLDLSTINILKEDYKAVMPVNVDFDSLFTTYLSEYTMQRYPAPAWFAQRLTYKQTQSKPTVETGTIYAVINGKKYEFGYDKRFESEELAKNGVLKIDNTAKFISKKEFCGYAQ